MVLSKQNEFPSHIHYFEYNNLICMPYQILEIYHNLQNNLKINFQQNEFNKAFFRDYQTIFWFYLLSILCFVQTSN